MAPKFLAAQALYRVFTTLTTEVDRDLPITIPLTLLRIAAAGDEGIDQGHLQDELKTSSATMSRTIQTLGVTHYSKDRAGFNLVERTMDPRDNRRRVLKLTSKGQQLVNKLIAEAGK